MCTNKRLKWAGGALVAVSISALVFGPLYRARDDSLNARSASEAAAQKQHDIIAQAEAERDAAIVRAHAVADANRIMSNSLRLNARYFMRLQKQAEEEARQ